MEPKKKLNPSIEGEVFGGVHRTHTIRKNSYNPLIIFLLFLLVFVSIVGGVIFGYLQYTKAQAPEVADIAMVQPVESKKAPLMPLAQGPQTYSYSHGKNVLGPKPQVVQISTIDPGLNGKQKVTVTIKHTSPITDVSVNLKTDNQTKNYPMNKVAGSDTDGTWEGEWTVSDSYNEIYFLEFDLKSTTTSYKDGLAFR